MAVDTVSMHGMQAILLFPSKGKGGEINVALTLQ
jgi:hypothetical protein